jgi:hypothetical protein
MEAKEIPGNREVIAIPDQRTELAVTGLPRPVAHVQMDAGKQQ